MNLQRLWDGLRATAWSWHELKLFIEHSLGVSFDALHVVVGVLLLITAAMVLRKPISSWRPWFVVLAFTTLNEMVDLSVERWPAPPIQYGESARDFLLTMLLPTILLAMVRATPQLFSPTTTNERAASSE